MEVIGVRGLGEVDSLISPHTERPEPAQPAPDPAQGRGGNWSEVGVRTRLDGGGTYEDRSWLIGRASGPSAGHKWGYKWPKWRKWVIRGHKWGYKGPEWE